MKKETQSMNQYRNTATIFKLQSTKQIKHNTCPNSMTEEHA
jgi:hypothetical protein